MGSGAMRAGLGLKGWLVLLVTVLSCVPLIGLAYALAACVLVPEVAAASPLHHPLPLALSGLLLAGVGGFVVWDLLGRRRRGDGRPLAPRSGGAAGESAVMTNAWQRMLCTIERQTEELDRFSNRLDSAYQELESANARLRDLSFKDELTRLYNRRFFVSRLEEEIARYRRFDHPVALVLLDVDGFKAVNDALGHAAGDETLRGIADILLKHSRGIDVIGRYGGDEFAVLLVEAPKAGARQYAERIRRLIAAHPWPSGRRVTASFGIAALPEDGVAAADALVQAADEALYAAKRAGRDRVALYEAPLARESQAV
jgi:diguanylate cyclase (GGDEF)-like protein